MSRLAGRLTFPGASSQEESSGDRNPQGGSGYRNQDNRNPEAAEYRNRNPENKSYRNPDDRNPENKSYRNHDNRNQETKGYRNPEKPRGKGNVRYQGTYTDRFQGEKPRSSDHQDGGAQKGRSSEKYRNPELQKRTARVEDTLPSEELLDLEDIIEQISDLNTRNDRSAAQIKRNILCSNDLLDTMSEDDWEKVSKSMLETAEQEPEFIADLMVALFKNQIFSCVISDEIMGASSKHIMESDSKPIPTILSAILCAHWPRQYAKAFDNVNPILYTVVCIIKGWIEVVVEDTDRYHKPEESKDTVVEEAGMVNRCAEALAELCESAQRQLWVNWMQVTDEIYECFKPAITHNPRLTGEVKTRILDSFIQMNQWTKTRQPGIKHAGKKLEEKLKDHLEKWEKRITVVVRKQRISEFSWMFGCLVFR
uniref:MIF4G domain-containing protein n=1 Tax=Caenorhabditis tropicalis TaxID=1561998 RepID=A0A1I7UJ58_9PELO